MGNTASAQPPAYYTTTISNPYAGAYTGYLGSGYALNPFLTEQNKMIEQTVPALYRQLLNPDLNSPINQARTQAFTKAFNLQSQKSFENNLINPLSQRRMLRSSLVNDLANNLQAEQTSQIADFNNSLLANSIADTQSLINMLMNQYKANASYGENALSNAFTNKSMATSYDMNLYSAERQKAMEENKNNSKYFNEDMLASVLSLVATIGAFL